MKLIDTHAHIYAEEFAQDREQMVARSLDQHVHQVYMPNIDASTTPDMLALEQQYPHYCRAMMGIHPCHIDHQFEQQLAHAQQWLEKRPFAAIGEIGMDLFRDKTFIEQQRQALDTQLSWAQQYDLPVVIHCRAALEETLSIIAQHQHGNLRGIFHCFSGTLQDAERIIALGFYLGIGGIVTFKKSGLDTVLEQIDLQHIVLETDAPYLAPTPYRGKRNEPAHLRYIADSVATIKQVNIHTVAEITTANAQHIFGEA